MYLKSVYIENNGPLRNLILDLPFREDGIPKPLILVGWNGAGKTNFLSPCSRRLVRSSSNPLHGYYPWNRHGSSTLVPSSGNLNHFGRMRWVVCNFAISARG